MQTQLVAAGGPTVVNDVGGPATFSFTVFAPSLGKAGDLFLIAVVASRYTGAGGAGLSGPGWSQRVFRNTGSGTHSMLVWIAEQGVLTSLAQLITFTSAGTIVNGVIGVILQYRGTTAPGTSWAFDTDLSGDPLNPPAQPTDNRDINNVRTGDFLAVAVNDGGSAMGVVTPLSLVTDFSYATGLIQCGLHVSRGLHLTGVADPNFGLNGSTGGWGWEVGWLQNPAQIAPATLLTPFAPGPLTKTGLWPRRSEAMNPTSGQRSSTFGRAHFYKEEGLWRPKVGSRFFN